MANRVVTFHVFVLSRHFLQVSAAMGFFLIPWAMLAEVYPTEVTGVACGITTCLSIKSDAINCTEGVFYFYGGITCVAVLFIYLYLPETFGKTLQEISEGFSKK